MKALNTKKKTQTHQYIKNIQQETNTQVQNCPCVKLYYHDNQHDIHMQPRSWWYSLWKTVREKKKSLWYYAVALPLTNKLDYNPGHV
jgi:hypothetical protein